LPRYEFGVPAFAVGTQRLALNANRAAFLFDARIIVSVKSSLGDPFPMQPCVLGIGAYDPAQCAVSPKRSFKMLVELIV
jgi:hypothetical protein